jgi:hypothetical protein
MVRLLQHVTDTFSRIGRGPSDLLSAQPTCGSDFWRGYVRVLEEARTRRGHLSFWL